MKLYVLPPSPRARKVMAVHNYLALECTIQLVDLSKGDQSTREYLALNLNSKMPVLEEDDFVLWESNAILVYLASKKPAAGLWANDARRQADILRWLCWEAAHWDQQSVGAVAHELVSKRVLGLGPPDQAFIDRGAMNFKRFAGVLDQSLQGRRWLVANQLSVADFAVGTWIPTAEWHGLPINDYQEIRRWYSGLMELAAWRTALQPAVDLVARMPPAKQIPSPGAA